MVDSGTSSEATTTYLTFVDESEVSGVHSDDEDENHYSVSEGVVQCGGASQRRGKKRRLDHLTWEEKLQRKKLKNRVAAQTSRDRKKAKMTQMEEAMQQLQAHNEVLMAECNYLKQCMEHLERENRLLQHSRRPLADDNTNAGCCNNEAEIEVVAGGGGGIQGRPVDREAAVTEQLRTGSTASSSKRQQTTSTELFGSLLPKGKPQRTQTAVTDRRTRSAAPLDTQLALLKTLLMCLLYRTCSRTSTTTLTLPRWSVSHTLSSRISPTIWKKLLVQHLKRNQKAIVKDKELLKRWWGRHQNNWNPPVPVKSC